MAETFVPTSTEFMKQAIHPNLTQFGGSRAGIANMISGGQLGNIIRFTDLDAATPLVFNPAVIVVTHVPGMWKEYPKMQEMLKSLVETHAKSITGIDFGYQMETQDTPVGHDGQTQKVPTRSTRSQISPSMTFQEVTGNLIWNLVRMWICDMQHPDTNASKLSAQLSARQLPAWLMSAYSMSMVAIQFDPTGHYDRIVDAAFYTNMFPTDTTELGIQRTINTSEIKERTIPFTGIVQHNENTKELGYHIAKMLQLHKINPEFALPGLTGLVRPGEGAITKTISKLGLYDQALGVELPMVTAFKPLGQDQHTDQVITDTPFQPDDTEDTPGGDPAGFTGRTQHPAVGRDSA